MSVERKYERDLDLLLAEEFAVNEDFAEGFKALTKFAAESASVVDYWVSKSDNLGESDLIIVYEAAEGKRFALLIEDKVDANLQPDQANRYRQRAERERTKGIYSDFELVLCAPQYYVRSRNDLDGFDRKISFEQIAEIISVKNDSRARYRSEFLKTAGSKRVNAWVRENDAATNDFWDAAYQLASQEFPILELKPLKLTKGSTWKVVRPHDMPTMPKYVYVALKGMKGHIDLSFQGTTAHLFHSRVKHLLEPGMTVHQTGSAAAIRLESSMFRINDGLALGIPKVKAAFECSARLIHFYRKHRHELDQQAHAATATELPI